MLALTSLPLLGCQAGTGGPTFSFITIVAPVINLPERPAATSQPARQSSELKTGDTLKDLLREGAK